MRLLVIPFLFLPAFAIAQKTKPDLESISRKHAIASFQELYDLLSLTNDAHFPNDIEKNIQWCEVAFAKRSFTTQRLKTQTVPLLLAERTVKNAKKTVLIYLQIDGQPVNPSAWEQEDPWKPVLKESGPDGKWKIIPYESLQGG